MNVIRRRGWEMPESRATPEHLFFNRRAFLGAAAGAAATGLAPGIALAQRITDQPDPTIDLYPGKRNETFTLDRPITDEKINGNYNNFYEFNSSKNVAKQAQALKIRPWTIKIDGMVEKPFEVGIDDLVRKFGDRGAALPSPLRRGLEHGGAVVGLPDGEARRDWRSRCRRRPTSAWKPSSTSRSRPDRSSRGFRGPMSRASPWRRRPTNSPSSPPAPTASRSPSSTARRSVWRCRGSTASSTSSRSCACRSPTSGRRAIGKTCRRPNTASGPTSIRRSPHPRWSQATEELIGTGERRPTLLFNGYGE